MFPALGAFLLAGAIAASTPTALTLAKATSDVSVAITRNADGTSYDLQVVNRSKRAHTAVVTQSLPADVTAVTATEGGTFSDATVTWRATLPPRSTAHLTTTLAKPSTLARQVSSVCAADSGSGRLHDCASAVIGRGLDTTGTPWWRSAYLLLLPALALAVWALRRRRNQPWRDLRRLAPLASIVVVLSVAAGALIFAGPYIRDAVSDRTYLGQVGWYGVQRQALLGSPASDEAVEFTVHRVRCSTGDAPICAVTAAFRNISSLKQPWYLSRQRLYTSKSHWYQPDAQTTRAANGGMNVFATPLEPGKRVLATLKFSLPAGAKPVRLELREGPAARGVFLTL